MVRNEVKHRVEEDTQIRGVSISGNMSLHDLHPYLPDDAYNAMLVYLVERAGSEEERWIDLLLDFEQRRREFLRFYNYRSLQFNIPVFLFRPAYAGALSITGSVNQWNDWSWEVSVGT